MNKTTLIILGILAALLTAAGIMHLSYYKCSVNSGTQTLQNLINKSVIREKIQLPGGEPINPQSILISIDKNGIIYRNGVQQAIEQIPETTAPKEAYKMNQEPILLEVDKSLLAKTLDELLRSLIITAYRVNISFMVTTPSGLKSIALPIRTDHGCRCLLFYYGNDKYNEHEESGEESSWDHLWIHSKIDDNGAFSVYRLRFGVYRERSGKKSDKWEGTHPPYGHWEYETLREFISNPGVKKLNPFIDIETAGNNKLSDFLNCLYNLRQICGNHVMVEIKTK